MSKVYGYSRSNRGQKGFEFQDKSIMRYSKNQNLKLEKIYSDSNSGSIVGSQLQRLINDIPNGSKLIVTKRSRISRNMIDYQLIYNELKSKEVEIIFIDEF